MNMITTNEIIDFVKENLGLDNVTDNTDIFDNRLFGDEFHELIEKFAETYSVDMTNYLWYFHADEGYFSFGSLFFEPPNKRVNRIPVTPLLLTEFANKGKWNIEYPEHKIPKRRYDTLINQISVVAIVVWIIVKILIRYDII